MARRGSSGLGRIGGALVVLGVVWFGLGYLRKARTQTAVVAPATSSVAPATSSVAPAASSAPELAPPPRGSSFLPRLPLPPDVSSPVSDGHVRELAVSEGSLYMIAIPARGSDDRKVQLVARELGTGTERVVAEVTDASDLAVVRNHLVWTERNPDGETYERRLVSSKLDGGEQKQLLPFGPMGRGFFPAGTDLVFRHDRDIYTLSPDLTLRPIFSIHVPGGVTAGDPDAAQKLLRMSTGMANAFGGDAERIYWSTTADTVSSSKLCSIARTGGAIAVEEAPPKDVAAKLFGVTDSGPVFSIGDTILVRERKRTRTIEGDASGMHLGARLVAGDLYVHVSRLVDQGELQKVVVRLRHEGTKFEPLVEATAFDVSGDKLYFATREGVREMAR